MKKLLLIGLIFSYAVGFAQQSNEARLKALSRINPDLLKMSAPAPTTSERNKDYGVPLNHISIPRQGQRVTQQTANEAIIGTTNYDLQTNNSISNRIVNNGDGTISASWTFSPNAAAGYPQRGTGYNYFDGTSWLPVPTARIEENLRAGFVNIGVTSTGLEVVMAHGIQPTGPSKGMLLTTRLNKGTGAWATNETVLGTPPADTIDLWSKMAAGGGPDGQSIHAVWLGGSVQARIQGQTSPIFYSRSTDNGATWDKLQTIIPEIDSNFYRGFSADQYSIDARGNNVAIVASALGVDVVLLKSTDNGDTWTKTIVSKYPIPLFDAGTMSTDTDDDGTPDTLWSGTGDPNVVIDYNNRVHVFFTLTRTLSESISGGLSYFPFSTQLFYWNDSYASDSVKFIAYAPDLDGDGVITVPGRDPADCPNDDWPMGNYGGVRMIEAPSGGVDSLNNIYVCYQTIDEISEPNTVAGFNYKLFKHPYIIKSTDGGDTWVDPNDAFDVLRGTRPSDADQKEGVFACIAKRVDSKIHVIYQRDDFPGNSFAVAGGCDQILNASDNGLSEIVYTSVDTSLAGVGIHELARKNTGVIISPNFPNPATASTQFNVMLNTASNVRVDVADILGQNVYSENKGKLSVGTHRVTLNTSYLSSGVYFYTVTAGDERVTGKMVVR